MRAVCGRDAVRGTAQAASVSAGRARETDWRRVVARDDIDLVDICTPGDTHAAIAIAALEAGKHVLCEKPLANTVEEAWRCARPPRRRRSNGVRAMVGFTYRRVPAIALARQLVADGRIGEVRQVRAQYLQDWLADPSTPHVVAAAQGTSRVGCARRHRGAHRRPDAVHHRQPIGSVTGTMKTFVGERAGRCAPFGQRTEAVTVDDMAAFLAHFDGGALGVFEATRFATGRKNAIRIEINGTTGSLAFDFEDMNVLHVHDESVDAVACAASAGCWSPSPNTRTSQLGGRRVTAWATSTDSPIRSSTW